MLQIQNTLISRDLFEKHFRCDLPECKGACCIEGDAGAPLSENDLSQIKKIIAVVKYYMREEGIDAIQKHGLFSIDKEGETVTPLVNGKECAYLVFDSKGITNCAFELAFADGKTGFKKPLSCHLYPVRISKFNELDAVNFHEWDICKPAFKCGKKSNVKVYEFLKESLIKKYGAEWFGELVIADRHFEDGKTGNNR